MAGTPESYEVPPVVFDVLVEDAASWSAEYPREVFRVEKALSSMVVQCVEVMEEM